ncbi:MAG: HAD-IA family hydrolase [Paracoccus sp. (in: a-proteobacteria)]|uniref:HAD-IA family hydrolase n=1 Tax=Paracoccus sp. TaxID=267 RepID=UPI0026E0426E|nr:HAD-IA family hydrolase [Paracoccus sp. (in: a-proteobacteria)]MDO5613603.1 HAD-IA family hydrolase [Paracoccus sp. (in: a-proteobacteria)]
MKLVVFDVDGTLVDSQALIVQAMNYAFDLAGVPHLPRETVLSIVGLSLPQAVAALLPDAAPQVQAAVVDGYKHAYMTNRVGNEPPLYPGARDCLDALAARDDLLLAVATGKSRRGLDAVLAAHGLTQRFISLQTADFHPSKPHPAMLMAALDDGGVRPDAALMIGDTSFDMEMARAAGVAGWGVGWGYHPATALRDAGAQRVEADFASLTRAIEGWAA